MSSPIVRAMFEASVADLASQSQPVSEAAREAEPSALERRIEFVPAFDKRAADPAKDYGIGAMKVRFLVIGPKGAVQWMIGTGWYTSSAVEHLANFTPTSSDLDRRPQGWDLGYHAKEPQYEGQAAMSHCELLGDGQCFYDGSSLNAELPLEGFLTLGLDYLWPKLEAEYRCRFEGEDWPWKAEAAAAREAGRYV